MDDHTSALSESLAAQRAVIAGLPIVQDAMTLADYAGLLRAMSLVVHALAQELAQAGLPAPGQLALLDSDLAALRTPRHQPAATLRGALLAQRIRTYAPRNHGWLLGAAGVLAEPFPAATLYERATALFPANTTSGLAWLHALASQPPAAPPIPAEHRAAAQTGASETLAGITSILAALGQYDERQPEELVRELNPAAGEHVITTNPAELDAALRAGERTLAAFPYYTVRYGERGAQFTRSDSAWLVTLAGQAQPIVEQQVGWLSRVLAARGMPRWLMQQHLEALFEELVAATPAERERYASLQHAAATLRESRERSFSDAQLAGYTAAFAQNVGPELDAQLPNTGGLLAAAVADERAGIAMAVESLERWMSDPRRFPPEWVAAVVETIRAARAGEL